jgi:maleate cis-trans isomerase
LIEAEPGSGAADHFPDEARPWRNGTCRQRAVATVSRQLRGFSFRQQRAIMRHGLACVEKWSPQQRDINRIEGDPMARRGDTRRIGLLLPSSNSVQEPDFGSVLPKDVTLHVARMRLSNVEADSTLRIVEEIEAESKKLADVDVDVILFAATAPSSRNGIGYDQELVKRISAASGKPATTASTALLEALRVLSAKRIVLGAPWSAPVNQTAAAFIEANGFEVLTQEALGHVNNLEIGLLDPETAYDIGRRIDRPEADAVMLACGNWSTFGIIERLEQDLGKPVLTTNQVSLWHALKIMECEPLNGLGVLLRDHLGGEECR